MTSDRLPDGIFHSPEVTFMRNNLKFPSRGGCKKDSGGKSVMQLQDDVIDKRKRVASVKNQMLAEVVEKTRVDHRSYKERGIERQPERHSGRARIRTMMAQDRTRYVVGKPSRQGEGRGHQSHG